VDAVGSVVAGVFDEEGFAMIRRRSMNPLSCVFVIIVIGNLLGIVVLGFLLYLSKPERLGLVPGSLEMEQISLPKGNKGIALRSDAMNYLGQLQGIGVKFDFQTKKVFVDRYIVRWHPLSRLSTFNDWPIVIETQGLPPGQYEVLYWTSDKGYTSAGTFNVTPE
jgi:hypothetical protein